MKKIYLLVLACTTLVLFSNAQCVIDSTNTDFLSPRPDSLPCVERTVPYSQTLQIAVPTSMDLQDFGSPISFVLIVDSVVINSVNGLPTGLAYDMNPSSGVLYGGDHGCATVAGTTTDAVGNYPITFDGFITLHGNPFPPYFDGDTTIDFATLQSLAPDMFSLFVDVINPGDECRPSQGTGIKNFSSDLNAAMSVYPNPNNGVFQFSLNAAHRVNGQINVIDYTGKVVYSQNIDVIGLYNTNIDLQNFAKGVYVVQVKTAEGLASKSISVQ